MRQPSREEALAEEKARVEGRVMRWITDDQAVARANSDGDRDGRWQDLQDVLEKGFTPEWSLLDEHPGSAASPAPKAIRVFTEQYLKMAEAYGKTGSPVGQEPGSPGVPGATMNSDLAAALPADRGLRGTAMDSQMAQVLQLQNLGGGSASPWLHRLVVHLLLTQRPDGVLEDVAIAGSSGNPIFDALALGHARDLSAHGLLTAPPPEHRKTIWAFEADFEQLPPAPVAGSASAPTSCPPTASIPSRRASSRGSAWKRCISLRAMGLLDKLKPHTPPAVRRSRAQRAGRPHRPLGRRQGVGLRAGLPARPLPLRRLRRGVDRQAPVGEAEVDVSVRCRGMNAVGNYAVQLDWTDGHQTGIYSWDYLLKLRG